MNTLTYSHLQKFTNPNEILNTYFSGLVARNKEKYGSYIRYMRLMIHLLQFLPKTLQSRVKWLVYQYVSCRWIDDVIDRDFSDLINLDIVSYAQKRFYFIESLVSNRHTPETAEDRLVLEAWKAAKENWKEKEIQESFRMIIESMQFDAYRIQEYRKSDILSFPKQKDLEEYFYNLDVIWTGTGMLVYLGSDDIARDLARVDSIGKACRIEYNLKDLMEDLGNGIVNITAEDATKYGITLSDLKEAMSIPLAKPIPADDNSKILCQDIRQYPLSIQHWIDDQIYLYHVYIDDFMQNSYPHFPFITRQVFQKFYLKPTQKGISQISSLLYA